jgi:hypothetical protein
VSDGPGLLLLAVNSQRPEGQRGGSSGILDCNLDIGANLPDFCGQVFANRVFYFWDSLLACVLVGHDFLFISVMPASWETGPFSGIGFRRE